MKAYIYPSSNDYGIQDYGLISNIQLNPNSISADTISSGEFWPLFTISSNLVTYMQITFEGNALIQGSWDNLPVYLGVLIDSNTMKPSLTQNVSKFTNGNFVHPYVIDYETNSLIDGATWGICNYAGSTYTFNKDEQMRVTLYNSSTIIGSFYLPLFKE